MMRTLIPFVVFAASSPVSAQEKAGFDVTLEEAYKREFAFLLGQQRQLEKRLSAMDAKNATEQKTLNSEMAGLENRIISLDGQLQAARLTLQEVERSAQTSSDDQQLIRATLEQAAQSLSDHGPKIDVPEDDALLAQTTVQLFEQASETLNTLSAIRRDENAEFFLGDGRKVTGTVVHLGRIAAYGVSDAGSGALAPAGGGKLKIWKDDAASVARDLAANAQPAGLGIFLYESLTAAVDEDTEESILEHITAGGAIAWVIVLLGLLGVFLAAPCDHPLPMCGFHRRTRE
ncbi:MAG: hypothetical protein AAFY60_19200 [Myxococcota bacterium]